MSQDIKGVEINVKRKLFSFSSEQDWVNRAQRAYKQCGVPKGFYITVDAEGHVMHQGTCFMAATKANLYPVTVYELETNWGKQPAAEVRHEPQQNHIQNIC